MSDPWNPKPAPSPFDAKPAAIGPMSLPATNVPAHPAEAAPILPPDLIERLKKANYPQDHIGVLMLWDNAKKAIIAATTDELHLRKYAVKTTFTAPVEGTNRVAIGNGMEAKAVIKFNYSLKSPDEKKSVVDAVDDVIDDFAKISNEGAFIAERLFKWTVDMSVTEYRLLVTAAKENPIAAKLLSKLETVLRVSDAAPTLEIVPEKKKKKK